MWKLLNGVIRYFRPEDETNEERYGDGQPIIQAVSRRGFLRGLGAIALAQAIPFNRVWSFPTVIRPINVGHVLALQLEKIRHQLAPLYERDDVLFDHVARMDVRNRLAWNGVPWDADMQLFGGGATIDLSGLDRTASGYDLQFIPKTRNHRDQETAIAANSVMRVLRAHRVLPLPE